MKPGRASSLGLALLLGLSAWGEAKRPADEARPPNVLLYVVDTLRADGLASYGNTTVETPATDALAREGVLFRNAYVHSAWTRTSIASILTGLYPDAHGVEDEP